MRQGWIKILLLSFAMISLSGASSYGQDPVFSQFSSAPLELNPALTGNTIGGSLALNYRNQWPGIDQAYVTYAVSYDHFVPYLSSGFGISLLTDNAGGGLYKTNNLNLHYAYNLRFTSTFNMKLGVEAGLINSRVNWSKLIFLDQIDPEFGAFSPGGIPYPTSELPPSSEQVTVFNVSAGIIAHSKSVFLGISLNHLNTPELSFLKTNQETFAGLPMRFSVHGGAELTAFGLGKKGQVFIAPTFQFLKQGDFSQINIGTLFRYFNWGTGVAYRHANGNPDAIILMVEGRKDAIKVAYSYDLTISSLGNTGGAHEISVQYLLDYGYDESRYNDCFNLFR